MIYGLGVIHELGLPTGRSTVYPLKKKVVVHIAEVTQAPDIPILCHKTPLFLGLGGEGMYGATKSSVYIGAHITGVKRRD